MKSTIATILGTAALGLLKKQMGSSTRFEKKETYKYNMYFYHDNELIRNKLMSLRYDLDLLQEKSSIEFVNDLYSTLFDPFIIYTNCSKYIGQFNWTYWSTPEENTPLTTEAKIDYLINCFDNSLEFVFRKENHQPINPENFIREFSNVEQSTIQHVLNKVSFLMYNRFPEFDCNIDWEMVGKPWLKPEIYNQFMNRNGDFPQASQFNDLKQFADDLGEEVIGWNVFREQKIFNADTGKMYKFARKVSKLRKR